MNPALYTANTRFGCRMMVLLNTPPQASQQLLLKANRSLSEQSTTPFPAEGINHIQTSEFLLPYQREDMGHHNDAVGLTSLNHDTLSLNLRETTAAINSNPYQQAVLGLTPADNSLFAHLRAATSGATSGPNATQNVHPYQFKTPGGAVYQFMHNGTLGRTPFKAQTTALIKQYLPQAQLYNSDSDTRRVFFSLMANLNKHYRTLEPDQLSTQQLQQALVGTCLPLLKQTPHPPVELNTANGGPPITGLLDLGPRNNFILGLPQANGGKRILAFKQEKPLFLQLQTNLQGQITQAVLASEPPNWPPGNSPANALWQELPDGHLLTLTQNPNGIIKAELTPFSQIKPLPKTPLKTAWQGLKQKLGL